ncbi:TPM domain-containing protein [Modestobacter sp. VKM Ac-2979]|uniref:TPM domain-containing protein n=1 Tax=unclassified Modestobacter TaxID=2643866 RepID=UPI0022AB8714|nr:MULTISPECIES: TPM domain-containing protein [unclassified Modestobacter]MCZ2811725.1 TPM domain-containing protein [Modestobacter sp. VKM Ac-2979]MCZ2843448.1 TPM domain-containing protein [Modestobacter sp. VKM Ac-2980]
MRRTWTVLGALVLVLLAAGPASAGPPRPVSGQLTDDSVVIGAADRQVVQQAVDRLEAKRDIGLHTVFVSDFDAVPAGEWAQRTAELSGLGDSDILLAVAVGGGTYDYGWWVAEGFPLPVADVDAVLASEVVPDLAARDWTQAVVTLAEQLRSLAETPAGAETPAAGSETAAGSEAVAGSGTAPDSGTATDSGTAPDSAAEAGSDTARDSTMARRDNASGNTLPWSGTTTLVVIGLLAVVLVSGHLLSRRNASSSSPR